MFTTEAEKRNNNEEKIIVTPIQESPSRISIYSINRCEDQVIGFEFVSNKSEFVPNSCCSLPVNLCIPVQYVATLDIESASFIAGDDPCYTNWIIEKTETPSVEIQRNDDEEAIGIIVRFFKQESCCYPPQMAFRLFSHDENDCKYSIASGLLVFV